MNCCSIETLVEELALEALYLYQFLIATGHISILTFTLTAVSEHGLKSILTFSN